jgi:hypothetical protein
MASFKNIHVVSAKIDLNSHWEGSTVEYELGVPVSWMKSFSEPGIPDTNKVWTSVFLCIQTTLCVTAFCHIKMDSWVTAGGIYL